MQVDKSKLRVQVRDYPQINIRVPPNVGDVLEAARFVRGHATTQELVRSVVIDYAEQLASEEPVRRALEARNLQLERSKP